MTDNKIAQNQNQIVPISKHNKDPCLNLNNKSDNKNGEKDSSYELIDNAYYYTDSSTGTKYIYDHSKGEWTETTAPNTKENIENSKENRSRESQEVTVDNEGRKYYWAEDMYLCQDLQGNIFYMDQNEWKPWSDKFSNDTKAEKDKWYFYKGDNTFYRDNNTNKVYKLNKETNEWEEYKSKKRRHKTAFNETEEFDSDEEEEEESSEEESDGQAPPGSKTDPSISFDGSIYTKHDASENMTYEWDPHRKAWFPKVSKKIHIFCV